MSVWEPVGEGPTGAGFCKVSQGGRKSLEGGQDLCREHISVGVSALLLLPLGHRTALPGTSGWKQCWRIKEAEMDGEAVHFCTDNQYISLHPQGVDSVAMTPAAPKMSRLVQATPVFMAVTLVFSLVTLFLMDHHHFIRETEMQELIQTFKGHMENSSAWVVEIQMLKCRVDNVNSQLQVLSNHLGNTSADIQMVKGVLKDATTLSLQTQMSRSSLEGTNADIQRLKGGLEKANALTSQTQNFVKSSLENTSIELHVLSRGLENANSEIQMLKAGLEMTNAQARLANSSLKNADAEIHVLRGHLDSVNDLRTQNQVLRSSLEGANAEIQGLKENLQNTNALNSQTQTLMKGSFDNTSAEIQLLRDHLERAGDEIHLLRRGLETVITEVQRANGRLDQTDAEFLVFKAEMENASTLNAQIQVLNGHMKNASRQIQTLKRGMKNASALTSQTEMLDSNLKKASAEIQRLREDLENTKALTVEIQQEQSRLKTLREVVASQEQLQRTQSQLLQMTLQGWKFNAGSLYYFSYVKKSWSEAEQFCVSKGAHLASVASEEEQAFLVAFTGNAYHWIGLTDRGTEGFWRWTDGTPFNASRNRQFWERNQPDNWRHEDGQTEDCVHIQWKWNDMNCDTPYQWVCKKPMDQGVA
ncbi:C-type lectin domain family 4 member F isoform X2 [Aotus nancymaae]|uniref:C-type lectin domain family 4 member F isoform X2 n=1 Tax=Aotus nancymaae TaxID=37293 RepID=UPI000625197D|nr:C-type lectin domain family 4 member F isoform X2 [Aotus nancymaae]